MGRHGPPNWQEKCLMIIEVMCEYECIGPKRHLRGDKCFPCEIYKIAHVGTAHCPHPDWDRKVNKLWKVTGGA